MNQPGGPPIFAWMNGLADATRARALRLVEECELTVADLCTVLQLPQSTVSRHLKVLSDDGWVEARSEGTSRFYRMATDTLEAPARRLWSLTREQLSGSRHAAHDAERLATVLAARQTRSQAFFSSSAGQWDRLREELFGSGFDLIALAGLLDEEWTIGDLGCGTGQFAERVAPFVRRVIAVDQSRAMLKAARQRLLQARNSELRQGRLDALPIDDGSLDAAILCLVLHHVADPQAVLRESARVLKPGGRLLVVDMVRHDRREYQQQMGHVWLGFEAPQFSGWLEAAGFETPRLQVLPPALRARGPALFAATARRPPTRGNGHHRQQPTPATRGRSARH